MPTHVYETVLTSRMRALLEKAHEEDEKDEMFAEEADDDEFAAPRECAGQTAGLHSSSLDVPLTHSRGHPGCLSRRLCGYRRRGGSGRGGRGEGSVEGRKAQGGLYVNVPLSRLTYQAKGKSKAIYNPHAPIASRPRLSKPKETRFDDSPTSSPGASTSQILLDPTLDPSSMAPSTLTLALRKQRREAKRLNRSENRRSNLRASTLATEEQLLEKERQEKLNPSNKGRRAQHETGESRAQRKLTQDELIGAALEEEERNKEALRDWVRREEERRELRRVGRKRVRGPRWSWVSRTVGRLVETVEDADQDVDLDADGQPVVSAVVNPAEPPVTATKPVDPEALAPENPADMSPQDPAAVPAVSALAPFSLPIAHGAEANPDEAPSGPYTRNYIILSQIPGGVPGELKVVLGDHVEWDQVKVIPGRNRPISK
jgi:hypothetical protein